MWDLLRVLIAAMSVASAATSPVAPQQGTTGGGRKITPVEKPVDQGPPPKQPAKEQTKPSVTSNQVGPDGKLRPIPSDQGTKPDPGTNPNSGIGTNTAQTPGFVTNVYTEASLKAIFAEVGAIAGVTIITDSTVTDTPVSYEFKNEPVESVIRKLARAGGYQWKKTEDGTYLVSLAAADSPLFWEFVEVRKFIPANTPVEAMLAMLPAKYKDYVQGDKSINTLTVLAAKGIVDQIVDNLRSMDTAPRQIVVEALITEVTLNKSNDFNFSWNWKNFGTGTDLAVSYTTPTVSDMAKLKMMIGNQKATIRANPRVSAFEGREALFNVGQELYFALLAGNTNFPFAQIQQIKTGVNLRFTGFIGNDGYITLKLDPEISDAVTVTSQGNPQTTVRKASTTVRVKNGETIVIGGLIQEFTKNLEQKVPILGDLPLIGRLFQSTSQSKTKTEVIIMVTPRIDERGAGVAGVDSSRPLSTPLLKPWDTEPAPAMVVKPTAGVVVKPVVKVPVKPVEPPKPPKPPVDNMSSIVVAPGGARNAYTWDDNGRSQVGPRLPVGLKYPADLVVVPGAIDGFGKPMEMYVLRDEVGAVGDRPQVRPVGLIIGALESNGEKSYKTYLIGVEVGSKNYANVKTLSDVPSSQVDQLMEFVKLMNRSLRGNYTFGAPAGVENATNTLVEGVLRKKR